MCNAAAPVAADRVLATQFGHAAVEFLLKAQRTKSWCSGNGTIEHIDLMEVTGKQRLADQSPAHPSSPIDWNVLRGALNPDWNSDGERQWRSLGTSQRFKSVSECRHIIPAKSAYCLMVSSEAKSSLHKRIMYRRAMA